eukprot:TRINITY_DN4233_c0_g1_i1.p1 TRINITY_DN4233_c0_g1~~TRINITY_DN4233_c0_g1_i1.p1  ORF type:complete len:280 (-),score=34.55 TRINITY_DN4233_c0_g1_i1:502-1296(-)
MCIRDRTTVVHQQVVQTTQASVHQWHESLFGCFSDIGSCCYGFLCPTCAFATARSNMDGSNCLFNCLCVGAAAYNVIRNTYNLEGSCVTDICYTCCCYSCSSCQLLREVKHRGRVDEGSHEGSGGDWHKTLFSCCDDYLFCMYAWLCCSCANATVHQEYDSRSNWCYNCLCFSPCATVNIIREGPYNLGGDCCGDVCSTWLCMPCAITRARAEIRSPGRGGIHAVKTTTTHSTTTHTTHVQQPPAQYHQNPQPTYQHNAAAGQA